MSKTIDVGALLDHGPWTAQQKRWTILAALAIIFDGFDIQILGFAIPSLIREWHVARSAFGPVLALGLAGMAAGSPLAGYFGDRFGRRTALIGCVSLFGLATVASSFVDGVAGLAVLRVLTGMGAGGALPNAAALSAEFAPLRRGHAAVLLTLVCVPLGGMMGGVIASQGLPALGWRALYSDQGRYAAGVCGSAVAGTARIAACFLARRPEDRQRLTELLRRIGHAPWMSVPARTGPRLRRQTVVPRSVRCFRGQRWRATPWVSGSLTFSVLGHRDMRDVSLATPDAVNVPRHQPCHCDYRIGGLQSRRRLRRAGVDLSHTMHSDRAGQCWRALWALRPARSWFC